MDKYHARLMQIHQHLLLGYSEDPETYIAYDIHDDVMCGYCFDHYKFFYSDKNTTREIIDPSEHWFDRKFENERCITPDDVLLFYTQIKSMFKVDNKFLLRYPTLNMNDILILENKYPHFTFDWSEYNYVNPKLGIQ